jgi:uncharacterized membrane protein
MPLRTALLIIEVSATTTSKRERAMRRRTIDLLASVAGIVAAIVLAVAGTYFFQRYDFAETNVRDQLRAQNIFFPPEEALSDAERNQPGVVKYAGQQVDTGRKAEVYANQFIGLHLSEIADGKTYSELSTESRENPDDEKLAGLVQTAFRGETLRGLLLTTYGFSELGQQARLMTYVSFAGAVILFVLSLIGIWHARRTHEIVT